MTDSGQPDLESNALRTLAAWNGLGRPTSKVFINADRQCWYQKGGERRFLTHVPGGSPGHRRCEVGLALQRYTGFVPANVNKDAAYRVKHGDSGWEVKLDYRLDGRRGVLLATSDHAELVDMVNRVKSELTGKQGGRFYINEFHNVLVPDGAGGAYFAGHYHKTLSFTFNDELVSALPPQGIAPGDIWPGPHAGVKYTLAAGGSDIFGKIRNGKVIETVRLSDLIGSESASIIASSLALHKGTNGGTVYINEESHFFAPVGVPLKYVYLGCLHDLMDEAGIGRGWFEPEDDFAE